MAERWKLKKWCNQVDVDDGKTVSELVADYGTPSASKNLKRARVGAEAPEALVRLAGVIESIYDEDMRGFLAVISAETVGAIKRMLTRAGQPVPEVEMRKKRNKELTHAQGA